MKGRNRAEIGQCTVSINNTNVGKQHYKSWPWPPNPLHQDTYSHDVQTHGSNSHHYHFADRYEGHVDLCEAT